MERNEVCSAMEFLANPVRFAILKALVSNGGCTFGDMETFIEEDTLKDLVFGRDIMPQLSMLHQHGYVEICKDGHRTTTFKAAKKLRPVVMAIQNNLNSLREDAVAATAKR